MKLRPTTHPRRGLLLAALVSAAAAAAGCNARVPGEGAATATTTTRETTDPGLTGDSAPLRELIARGGVPAADLITVEGMLRDHPPAADEAGCDSLFCVRPAVAVAEDLRSGEREYFVEVHSESVIERSTFVRPALDLIVGLDRSAAMASDMPQVNEAVTRLIRRLRPDDHIAILAYNDTIETVHPLGPIGDRAALEGRVRAIDARGDLDMTRGIREAYDLARAASSAGGRLVRVVLFSCANPQGLGLSEFEQAVLGGEASRQPMTFFGVLLGNDPLVANALSMQHGSQYYALSTLDAIERAFDGDLDRMMTPVAYDMQLTVRAADGFEARGGYGAPFGAGASAVSAQQRTMYLGDRPPTMVMRLARTAGAGAGTTVANTRFALAPERAVRNEAPSDATTPLTVPAGSESGEAYYSNHRARTVVALVNHAERLRDACAAWHSGDRAGARAVMTGLLVYLRAAHAASGDAALLEEIRLAERLHSNMGG